MTNLWQDIRFGLRVLAKSPAFTFVAVLTLALGIGANTAIFTIVYGVLLRPLPFPHPDRIVQLAESYKEQSDEMDLDSRELKQLQSYKEPFENIAGYTSVGYNLAVGNAAEHLRGMPVDSSYFSVLGIHPALGRDFSPEDNAGDGQRVAIISYNLWARRFASDPALIGRNILLNGEPFSLVGVMPRDFAAIAVATDLPNSGSADVWTPLALVAKTAGSGENIGVLARLKPGVTPAQLQAQMNIVTQDFRREFPGVVGKELKISFRPYLQMIGADVRPYLLLLLGSIGFVLLIACANVANLFLARGSLRGREIAVRIAMGASPGRLFQQLLTESMLIALAGGAVGLLLAYLGLGSLMALAPVDLPRVSDVHLDGWVFAFTFFVSLLTGVLFGLAPALDASRTGINEALKEGAGRSSAAPGRARLRQLLVIGEFAISVILLTGAGLMIATFSKLIHTDPGFNPQRILSAQFWLIGSNYNSEGQIENFDRAIVQRLEAIPGVDAAAVIAAGLPLERGGNNGVRLPNSPDWYSVDYREITPGFFRAMGIPLRQGREFSESDSETADKVVIVNQAFVRKHFPSSSPIDEHIFLGKTSCEIIGVVGDVKSYLDQPAPPATFIPAAQASYGTSALFEGWFPRIVLVRSNVDPLSLGRAVRDSIAAVDPTVPTGSIRSMEQVLSHSLALRSFMMFLLGLFAVLALVLASVGIYGVISFAVSQRTREIGVRMALGAHPRDVLQLILGEGLKLVLAGVVLGIIAALAMTRLLSTLIYGVRATDPLIFLSVVALLVAVALAACFVPARRAMRVDPIVALRYE
ncbi:MAG: ABC transporter permease [Candidatus Acidiferrum sp.]|jgi:putative ABC transport system permease protein